MSETKGRPVFTEEQQTEARRIASDLSIMHARLISIGLFKTAHALQNGALQQAGYEIGERMPVRAE